MSESYIGHQESSSGSKPALLYHGFELLRITKKGQTFNKQ